MAETRVTLVDLKIECGLTADGQIVVADVIDNDSWRIWLKGDKNQMFDKQIYRDASDMTAEVSDTLKKNYVLVAEMTKRFLWDNREMISGQCECYI